MSITRRTTWGNKNPSVKEAATAPSPDKFLSLLVEGAAQNMPEVDAGLHKEFRANVGRLALQLPDLPEEEKLALIRTILQEFENYRSGAETALRVRAEGWQELATALLSEVLKSLGAETDSAAAVTLAQKTAGLTTAEEMQAWRGDLKNFLHSLNAHSRATGAASLKPADQPAANDNAAGLRGGGAAQEHIKKIQDRGGVGCVVLFRLGLLDVIGVRFGVEAVQDSIMAVSAFLTNSLRSNDAVYHWNDSSLLIVLESPASEQIISAAMQRIANNNRDITIKMDERTVMLRIPLQFELAPIARFQTPEDLMKFSRIPASKW